MFDSAGFLDLIFSLSSLITQSSLISDLPDALMLSFACKLMEIFQYLLLIAECVIVGGASLNMKLCVEKQICQKTTTGK